VSQRDYYDVLGLTRTATPEQIKRGYRRLAKKYHPDHYKGKDAATASGKFNEVQEAYAVLSDPEKRKLYDQFGHSGVYGGGPSVAQRVWRTGPANFNVRDFGEGVGGFESVFEQFFGRSRNGGGGRRVAPPPPRQPTRGKDITHDIKLPFIKAALGTKATIKLKTIGGSNTGKLQALDVKIPPGVGDGSKIRIRGKGRPSAGRGPAGDLYLKVKIEPHAYFRREGRDIYVDLPVSFTEAALGTRLDVPTLHGTTAVKVPAGVSSGQKLRLRGKGIPAAKAGGKAGDQYAVIKIVSPSKLSPEAEKLLKQFQQVCKFEPERFK